jgi:hypothetical protein
VWVVTYANNVDGNFSASVPIGGQFDFREQSRIFGQGDPLHLYVVFQAYATKGGLADIFFTESLDGGASWGAAKALTPAHAKDGKHRYTPAMVVLPNGDVYVVYNKGNTAITWRKRVNGSANWSNEASITAGVGSTPRFPNIAYTVNGNTTFLHVIISAGGGNDSLYYTRSSDGGSSWSSAKIISDHPDTSKRNAFVSDLANKLYMAYADSNSQGPIKFVQSLNNGDTWSAPLNVFTGAASYPSLAFASKGTLHLIYQIGFAANSTLAYRHYDGSAWTDGFTPQGTTVSPRAPVFSAGKETLTAVFHAKSSASDPEYHIFANSRTLRSRP